MSKNFKEKALSFLDELGVAYQVEDHPAVFTVAESSQYETSLPGHDTKNLFLRDKKKENYYLFVVSAEKRVDLKALSSQLAVPRFSFASANDLEDILGTTPGSVSFLSIINDSQQRVQLWMDQDIKASLEFKCHPLINTATVAIATGDIDKITARTGHSLSLTEIPEL